DSYSEDLQFGYSRVLPSRGAESQMAVGVAQQWARLAGPGAGAFPAGLGDLFATWHTPLADAGTNLDPRSPTLGITSSVGAFERPNPFETGAAMELIETLRARPAQEGDEGRRHLLVVTGQAQPSRRFLRELARSEPGLPGRFVVATGDGVSFNAV